MSDYHLIFKSLKPNGNRSTEVVILDGEKFVSSGISVQSIKDNDSRYAGQKHALEHALNRCNLDKNERAVIWHQFFNRSKRNRKVIGEC